MSITEIATLEYDWTDFNHPFHPFNDPACSSTRISIHDEGYFSPSLSNPEIQQNTTVVRECDAEADPALKSLVGHYKEIDKLVCELIPWPAGMHIQLDRHRRLDLTNIEYVKKGLDAILETLKRFCEAHGARLDMRIATASLQQLKELYYAKDRTDAVIGFLIRSEKISLDCCQSGSKCFYRQASSGIQKWEDNINEYIEQGLASIHIHNPLDPTKSWATNLSFTSPNNSPDSMPPLRDTDSVESRPMTYISRSPEYPDISVSVHSTTTNAWEKLHALRDTGASGDWISKDFLCDVLKMEIDKLSASEVESERFYGFSGHSVRPLGKKKLTWRARNGVNGQLSGLAHKSKRELLCFTWLPNCAKARRQVRWMEWIVLSQP